MSNTLMTADLRPFAPAASGPVDGRMLPRWHDSLHRLLLVAFMLFTFVGTQPLNVTSSVERAEGNPLERFIVLGIGGLGLALIWFNRRRALACVMANGPLFMVLAIILGSIAWSEFPALTLRRALVLALLTAGALGIAAGTRSLRDVHTLVFATMSGVVVLNLVATVIWPAQAISSIGVHGLLGQKNIAGEVSMLAVVIGVTWTAAAEGRAALVRGWLGIGVSVLFLVLSRSKTSMALTVLALGVTVLFMIAETAARRLLLLGAGVGVIAILVFSDFDVARALGLFVADASFTGRDELWAFAWRTAQTRFWLGHGYGAFWDVGDFNDPLRNLEPGTWLGEVPKGVINQAHNGYLELWLNVGLPTTILAVVAVVAGIAAAGRQLRDSTQIRGAEGRPGRERRALLAAIAMVLALYLLHNLTEATIFSRNSPLSNLALLLQLLLPVCAVATLGHATKAGQRLQAGPRRDGPGGALVCDDCLASTVYAADQARLLGGVW